MKHKILMAGYPLSAGNYIARVTPGYHLLGKTTESEGIFYWAN
jgi:hypothetical protein